MHKIIVLFIAAAPVFSLVALTREGIAIDEREKITAKTQLTGFETETKEEEAARK
jgi:hypothetical protein